MHNKYAFVNFRARNMKTTWNAFQNISENFEVQIIYWHFQYISDFLKFVNKVRFFVDIAFVQNSKLYLTNKILIN